MLMTWWGSWSWFKDKNRNKDKKDVYEICLPRHQNYSVRFINWRERILRDRKWFQIGVEVTKEMTTWYRRSGILMILILLGSRALLRQSSGSKSGKIGINIFRISAWTFLDATADFKLQRSGKRRSVSYFKTQTLSVGFALLTDIGPFKMLCRFFTVHCVPSVIDIVLKIIWPKQWLAMTIFSLGN